MKKIFLASAVVGLLAVPTIVIAQHGNSTNKPEAAEVEQEAEVNDANEKPAATTVAADTTTTPTTTSTTPKVEADETENENENAETHPTFPAGSITLDQAKTIAQNTFPGKTIKKTETENEHGTATYSIRFTDGSRVDVRASDGVVVRTKLKTDHSGHN